MVAPITGPFSKVLDAAPSLYHRTVGYKQVRPYNLSLSYTLRLGRGTQLNYPNSPNGQHSDTPWMESLWKTSANQTQVTAYARLISAISDRANMGENIGQLSATVRLITDKLSLLRATIVGLRKADPAAFRRWQREGISTMPSHTAARYTLEINFAIVPTISDIFSAINFLQNPIKSPIVKAKASGTYSGTGINYGPYSPYRWGYGNVKASYGARIAISNPNLYAANAMGLVNPAQIAWQLLPGSFLVDWLIPVEQFLGSFTDFLGLIVEDAWTTVIVKGTTFERWNNYGWGGKVEFTDMSRISGITYPSLKLRPLRIPGVRRMANTASLAILAFGGKPGSK